MSDVPPEHSVESADRMAVSDEIEILRAGIIARLVDLLKIDPRSIELDEPLGSYGLDSMMAAELAGDLEVWLKLRIPEEAPHEHGTVRALAEYLAALRRTEAAP